jgi:hypothetical protein
MAAHPDATVYSDSQNDTQEYCQCDDCTKLAGKYGGQSGLYLWFVNQIADAIAADHPGKLIDTLAYQFTEEPPRHIAPRPNVRVRLCPIAMCDSHPLETCTSKESREFVERLAGWSKLTDNLYIWHYTADFAHYLMPFPDFHEFPQDLRLYQRLGIKGVFAEGDYAPGGGGSDAELRTWVMSRLLWNPAADDDALVTEWMQGVYGQSWKPMRQWFDLLHQRVRGEDQHLYIHTPVDVHFLSHDVCAQGEQLIADARRTAVETRNNIAAEYIDKTHLWLRYVELERDPTAGPELSEFAAELNRFGVQQTAEGQPASAWLAGIEKRAKAKKK